MTRFILSDEIWASLQKMLRGAGCYQTLNLRMTLEGIFWRLRTGSPWRDLPTELGAWNAIYRVYNRWSHTGVIDELLEYVEGRIDYRTAYIDGTYISAHQHATGCKKGSEGAIGISRGGRTTKIHGVCDRQGKPVSLEVTAGNISDISYAETVIDDLASAFDEIVGDKGYDSDSLRLDILANEARPVIPTKSNSKRKNPGFHKTKYKKRHRIENLFARLKHFRAIATRYDKLKAMFESTVKIGVIAIWLGLTI